MLSLISPAKSLDFETQPPLQQHSQPIYQAEAAELVEHLRPLSPQALAELMGISDKLGTLNAVRYQQWALPFDLSNAKQAAFAFTGDVYTGLNANHLDQGSLDFGQQHLKILSGLYGLLRPLDLIQPYRLEMSTRFTNQRGKDLYAFWRPLLAKELAKELAAQTQPVLINLSSQEYFKAVDVEHLPYRIITPQFKDWKNGQYKIISFYAKKARGLMCRFQLENRIDQPEGLKDFDLEGYQFNAAMSEADDWVFTRRDNA